jgi:acyl transferase domain-containing protein
MGKQLYETESVFRDALDRCASILDTLLPQPLLSVMYAETDLGLLKQTRFSQPAIFSLQFALCEWWKSRGVLPCAVLGHSVGEYCAAVVAGCMSLEDGLRLIAARGRLIADRCEANIGAMVAVFTSEKIAADAIKTCGVTDVSIAAVNGPKMVVLSGPREQVEQVVSSTGATGRPLEVSHAFHSPLMAPVLEPFASEVKSASLTNPSPSIRFFSTLHGREVSQELCDLQYWVDHVPGTVRFMAATEQLTASVSPDFFVEIGASPVLINMAKRFVTDRTLRCLPSLDAKSGSDVDVINSAVAEIGTPRHAGVEFNRQSFPWREAGHPLLRRRSVRADGAVV